MRVLFIGFVWPEPKSSAAGQNILSYMYALRDDGNEVFFCSAAEKTEQSQNLENDAIPSFPIVLNCSSFDSQVTELAPDIVIFDRFLCYEQFAWRVKKSCPEALLVLDAEDLHFLRKARQQAAKVLSNRFVSSPSILANEQRSLLLNELTKRELACIYQADLTVVLSDFEQELLTDIMHVPKNQIAHCPFIINSENASLTNLPKFQEREDFVFIGNFRHAPNYHSAKILRENIWPFIVKHFKKLGITVKCHVYGAYLSPKAKQLENAAIGFHVHGFAENQFDVIKNARVMLAPIQFGAGVKGKFLDAMLCGTPSITSPIGAEGISKQAWGGFIVDDFEAFISSAIELYSNEKAWTKAVKNGEKIIQMDYAPALISRKFIDIIQNGYTNRMQNRSLNILQQVMSHHQFQTSQYMSQWIEAKTQLSKLL